MLYDKQVSVKPIVEKLEIQPLGMSEDVQRMIEGRVGLGYWEMAPMGRAVVPSQKMLQILRLPLGTQKLTSEQFAGCFVPSDKILLMKALDRAVDKKIGFEAVLRLYFKTGIRVVEVFGDVVLDPGGGVANIAGSIRDITMRAENDAISRGRAGIMRVIMRDIPSAVAVMDTSMKFLSVSDHWVSGHGYESAEAFLGKCIYDVFAHSEKNRHEHQRVLKGETIRSERPFLKDHEGNPIVQHVTMCPWKTGQGVIGGMIFMMGQVDERNADADLPEVHEKSGLLELLEQVS